LSKRAAKRRASAALSVYVHKVAETLRCSGGDVAIASRVGVSTLSDVLICPSSFAHAGVSNSLLPSIRARSVDRRTTCRRTFGLDQSMDDGARDGARRGERVPWAGNFSSER